MKSGVRKSGCPIPRLIMSRPCAASALARASTAKAFSSPIRSNADTVRSMLLPTPLMPRLCFYSRCVLVLAAYLKLGHAHDLENDGDRPADQQQAVEGNDRAQQTPRLRWQRVAVAERGVILERKFERANLVDDDSGRGEIPGPDA